jgi:hypothetical protein
LAIVSLSNKDREVAPMPMVRNMDAQLFEAVLKVAREECEHGTWDELSPILRRTWEALRDAESPTWETVEGEVQATCRESGYLH